ncbi:MAG: hypothetical protein IJ404_01680 [Clostridia bacterium]|nr:hypothetical protein [Clostridia bacterium]
MKTICIEIKILMMIAFLALILGIITVTPCAGNKGLLGRCYGIDRGRCKELAGKAKNAINGMCK